MSHDPRNPLPKGLRESSSFRAGTEIYVFEDAEPYDTDPEYAQFHIESDGTVMLIAHGGPEVPLEVLEFITYRARHLQKEGM